MSKHRIRPDAGFVDQASHPKGPNGLPLCRFCKTECPPPRRTFCSDACVFEWKLQTQPGFAARQVFARDRGVCQQCGVDCITLLEELRRLRYADRLARIGSSAMLLSLKFTMPGDAQLPRFKASCDELELSPQLRGLSRRLWEMDHTVPVIEGGGSCGLDNLRTLCWRCHRLATAALAARRAEARKAKPPGPA